MDSTSEYGPPAELNAERDFHFVDTLATYETFWSFDSEELKDVSNQYAAMPSLHTGWSMWAALVLLPMVRRRWLKALIALHPVATVFCIVVTGNHFWLDAVGGAAILGAGFLAGRALAGWWDRRAALRRPDGVAVVAAEGDQLLLGSGPDPQP